MTLCNMATEFAAMTAFVAPDHKTLAYLEAGLLLRRGSNGSGRSISGAT
jgi:homoaconitase/3-isopropylmalate dehydratase large subunit